MKVVFDTNVFVAALTLPGGRGDQAIRKIVEGEDSLALSKPILDELLTVLVRAPEIGALTETRREAGGYGWT